MPESNPDPSAATSPTPEKKAGAFQISPDPVIAAEEQNEGHKFEIGSVAAEAPSVSAPAFEDLGELPESYFEDTLFLVARDPRWLFSYWDFNWGRFAPSAFRGGVRQFFLKVSTVSGGDAGLVEINPEARNWYIPVNDPDMAYTAEIGFFNPAGAWQGVVQSGVAATPADSLAPEAIADFATVPLTSLSSVCSIS